ncbi:hypothetical protein Agabi119p4_3292 [Agaricus bisporus var. burnettii]|uniref:Uncharacterized protein n=1 Tax=Agaricus bisporus var. burnettii TaxID=192524 RepID=A0A8H7F6T4_AGABI|nr:hypothetical protein Agabi119p4_3292 [Agaricus bisporus var. burnettii]
MEKVKEKHTLQVNTALLNVYQSHITLTDEEEEDFQANVSAFLNESTPLRKLKTIQALNTGKEDILFVELPSRGSLPRPTNLWTCLFQVALLTTSRRALPPSAHLETHIYWSLCISWSDGLKVCSKSLFIGRVNVKDAGETGN